MSTTDLIKQRLAKLQSKSSGNSEKIDYSVLFWKPKLGKQVIRIVPRKANKDYPFAEVSFHQYNVFKKSIYCLENFGEKDPVMELVKELYNENTDESKDLAKKIRPRTKYFAQVVVRGEEHLGTRLWEFNKTTYEKLLSIMADDDFGDVSDIVNGTDLTVEGYNDSIKIGKKDVNYIAVNITPKRNTSPLSTDEAQVKGFLENQKDVMEVYKKYSFDEIKQMLKNYLTPSEGSVEESEEEPVGQESTVSKKEFESDTTVSSVKDLPWEQPTDNTTADKFKGLFESEED